MILARAGALTAATAIGLVSTSAQADVLEIDADGARWVAGGNAVNARTPASILSASTTSTKTRPAKTGDSVGVNIGALIVPDEAVSNTAANASGVPLRYAAKVNELAQRYDLSASLIEALVWQESRWRENAVSSAGARGLAQLMPGTAKYLGVNPDDPMQNLEGGARYLREQLNRFDGNLEHALAAYNAGPGRVIRAGGIPNIRETRHYVAAIMGRLASHSRDRATR